MRDMALVLILILPLPRNVVDDKASNLIRIRGLIQSSNPKSWASLSIIARRERRCRSMAWCRLE